MHARVTRSTIAPERVDEAVEWFEQTALPRAKSLAGFRGALTLYDRKGGAGMTVTLWESAADLEASEAAATGIREDGASAVAFDIESVARFEVTNSSL